MNFAIVPPSCHLSARAIKRQAGLPALQKLESARFILKGVAPTMDLSVLIPLSNLPERAHACLESLEWTVDPPLAVTR